jgi:membrane protein implicated in regulation of membrane protease activity
MRRLSTVLLVVAAVAGCKKSEPAPAAMLAPAAPALEAAAPAAAGIQGKIVERIDAAPYSYLKLATAQGEVWAAVPKTDLNKGAEVTVEHALAMNGFESKSLNRKFDVVYFGNLAGAGPTPETKQAMGAMGAMGGAPGQEGPPPNMAAQHANVAKGPTDVADVKVAKAGGADARTVAEVHAQRTALKEKAVTVQGKVVKYNGGIMGKNWLHLRDGSGKGESEDNDLTVTSQDVAKVGDVVVVKGVVRIDNDFGAGYAYKVIVEDAKISK